MMGPSEEEMSEFLPRPPHTHTLRRWPPASWEEGPPRGQTLQSLTLASSRGRRAACLSSRPARVSVGQPKPAETGTYSGSRLPFYLVLVVSMLSDYFSFAFTKTLPPSHLLRVTPARGHLLFPPRFSAEASPQAAGATECQEQAGLQETRPLFWV